MTRKRRAGDAVKPCLERNGKLKDREEGGLSLGIKEVSMWRSDKDAREEEGKKQTGGGRRVYTSRIEIIRRIGNITTRSDTRQGRKGVKREPFETDRGIFLTIARGTRERSRSKKKVMTATTKLHIQKRRSRKEGIYIARHRHGGVGKT